MKKKKCAKDPKRFLSRRQTNGQEAHEKMLTIFRHQGKCKSKPQLRCNNQTHTHTQNRKQQELEKEEPSCVAGGDVRWCSCWGTSRRNPESYTRVAPQTVKHRVTTGSSDSSARYTLESNASVCPHTCLYLNVQSSVLQGHSLVFAICILLFVCLFIIKV